jgi:hypothetical protein
VGWWLRPPLLVDDAAISLRYAERLATGQGLTYNDHEHVFGASNPLWVLLVAAGRWLGVETTAAATVLAVATFAVAVGLGWALAERLSNPLGGAVAAGLLVLPSTFRDHALSGLEVGLAAALGLGAILAVSGRRHVLAGVLLGLALVTKADAAALLLAVVIAAGVRRRETWRLVGVAVAVAGPWFVFAWLRFGSPIPRSVDAKLGDAAVPFDTTWVVRGLWWEQWLLLAAAATFVVWRWPGWGRDRRSVVVALLVWFAGHALAYSVVDLGAPYPWYLALLTLAPAILAGAAGGAFAMEVLWNRRRPTAWALPAALATTTVVGLALAVGLRGALLLPGQQPLRYQRVDQDRRAAGRMIAAEADPGDVVESCFGWIAFEVPDQTVNDPCGLNTDRDVMPADWVVVPGPSGVTVDPRTR